MPPRSLFCAFNVKPSPLPSPRRTLSTPSPSTPKKTHSRLRKLNDRLPPFLRTYTTPLLGAPITHITSFLILHEITAVVPLFGLVAAFHYGNWMPEWGSAGSGSGSDSGGGAFDEGARRFGRWLRKKGWVEDGDVDVAVAKGAANGGSTERVVQPGDKKKEQKGPRLVVEFATAYAITKALLPVRIVASVWTTPWFARSILAPLGQGTRSLFGRK